MSYKLYIAYTAQGNTTDDNGDELLDNLQILDINIEAEDIETATNIVEENMRKGLYGSFTEFTVREIGNRGIHRSI